MPMNKFWNFDTGDGERILRLDGAIAESTWWGDELTAAAFKGENILWKNKKHCLY